MLSSFRWGQATKARSSSALDPPAEASSMHALTDMRNGDRLFVIDQSVKVSHFRATCTIDPLAT
jgi:hypothetical protein